MGCDMTDVKKLRELAVMAIPKIPGICNECSFELSYRHWYGCSIPEDAFAEAINPQAIIEILDRLERYREALRSCEVRSGHIENWHRDHVTPDNFKDCQDVGVTPEAYLRETKMIAREALEGGK